MGSLRLYEASLFHFLQILLRIFPWFITILSANLLHYSSLLEARSRARLHARATHKLSKYPPNSGDHSPLSFQLMKSPAMRLVRYRIKLIRYSATLSHLLLFYCLLPELNRRFVPGWGTIEGIIVGLLSGFVTIYLNENRMETMRTLWRPKVDLKSQVRGYLWDAIRLAGGSLAAPFEEELFYHSWLYRFLCQHFSKGSYHDFTEVPFREWNRFAWLAANAFLALFKGKEWKSYGISGLLSNWAIARRGQFFDGVIAHSIRNLTISFWVLGSGERQFW